MMHDMEAQHGCNYYHNSFVLISINHQLHTFLQACSQVLAFPTIVPMFPQLVPM
jgi:hypothetical protein